MASFEIYFIVVPPSQLSKIGMKNEDDKEERGSKGWFTINRPLLWLLSVGIRLIVTDVNPTLKSNNHLHFIFH